jgi:hypothetical protein
MSPTKQENEMLEGIKILIERMEQDPDKFSRNYRLCDLVGQVIHDEGHVNYTKEERDAILDAHRRMARKNFTAGVLDNLDFQPDRDVEMTLPWSGALVKQPMTTTLGPKIRMQP